METYGNKNGASLFYYSDIDGDVLFFMTSDRMIVGLNPAGNQPAFAAPQCMEFTGRIG